ncbi:hypothetical protein [Micromonospora radicis]|uniref:hypothetical protein n=1 Tax=Micromonospora radicis TaxID=1894971 RepID=UPI001F304771|nr:hypothetical protein [Micromonospora radicis]
MVYCLVTSGEAGIDGLLRQGVASRLAHEAYLTGLGDGGFDAEKFLEGGARPVGSRLGVRYGTSFEVFHLDLW